MPDTDFARNVLTALLGVGFIIFSVIDLILGVRRGYYWNRTGTTKFERGSLPVMFWVGVCGDIAMWAFGVVLLVWSVMQLVI